MTVRNFVKKALKDTITKAKDVFAVKEGSSSQNFSANILKMIGLNGGVRALGTTSILAEDAFIIICDTVGSSPTLPSNAVEGQMHMFIATANNCTLYGPTDGSGSTNFRIFQGNGIGMYTTTSYSMSQGCVYLLTYTDGI